MTFASRVLSAQVSTRNLKHLPAPKYLRKGNLVVQIGTDGNSDTVLFTGQVKLLSGDTVPSISAAKRYVRQTLRPKYGELRVE